jgi:hypothetical protein
MTPSGDLLEPAHYGPEIERDAAGPVRAIGGALTSAGILGLAATASEPHVPRAERIVAAVGSATALGLGASALAAPGSLAAAARKRPRAFALANCVTAIGTVVAGGGHRSPAFFPTVVLTAAGAWVAGESRAGRRIGATVATGYLGGCFRSLAPWRQPLPRGAWWNVAAAVGIVAAGEAGARVGNLSLLTRTLSDLAAQEGDGGSPTSRRAIEEDARRVREVGESFLRLLPEVDRHFSDDPAVADATGEIATALASLRTASGRISAEDRHAPLGLWDRLEGLAASHNERAGNVRVRLVRRWRGSLAPDAVTAAMVYDSATALVQNAANARGVRQEQVRVALTLERRGHEIVLDVEDDAGGPVPPRELWRQGLTDCSGFAEERGGRFSLEQGAAGLRAILALPYIRGRAVGTHALTVSERLREGRDQTLGAVRVATIAQGFFTLLSVTEPRVLPRRLIVLAGLCGAGELAAAMDDPSRARVEALLSAAGMSAFRGPGRPPVAGWSALLGAQMTARGNTVLGALGTVAGVVGATIAAGPERFGAALPVTISDRTFPLIGALAGCGICAGLEAVQAQEDSLVHEAWARQILSDLAGPGRAKHNFLDPLERALGKSRWDEFCRTSLGTSLVTMRDIELMGLQRRLQSRLQAGDPLRRLQHQVARLLAGAPVRVLGSRPGHTTPLHGKELDAVRYRLGLITLGQAIAEAVRMCLPTAPLGRVPLHELQLHLAPGDLHTAIEIIPIPYAAGARDRAATVLDVASRRAGGRGLGFGDGLSVLVDNTAFA